MVLALMPFLTLDFSASDGGAVSGGDTGQWAWGVPKSGPSSVDNVWGTNLSGNYLNDTVDWLEVALPDVSKYDQPLLELTHWYAINPSDNGTLQVRDGGAWSVLEPVYGYPDVTGFSGGSSDWSVDYFDLSAFTAPDAFRFVLTADQNISGAGWYLSSINMYDGEVVPPQIQPISLPVDTQDYESGHVVEVLVTDISTIVDVSIKYQVNGGAWQDAVGSDQTDGVWQVVIPAQEPDSIISWYLTASDDNSVSRYPEKGEESFRVYLAAPSGLSVPDGRLVSSILPLTWDAPNSPHVVQDYSVYQGGVLIADTLTAESAELAVLADTVPEFVVTAQYDWGEGDASDPLWVELEVPELTIVTPSEIYIGSSTYVDIHGSSLYLTQQGALFEAVTGVVVEQIEVIDVNHMRVLLAVAEETAVGQSDITVWGEYGPIVYQDALGLLPASDAPSVVGVSPASVLQGEEVVFVLTTNAPLGPKVGFTLAEGITLIESSVVTENEVQLQIAIDPVAGVGEYVLVMDDGVRLWPFVIEVREKIYTQSGGCAVLPFGHSWSWLLVFGFGFMWRRRRATA